MNEDSEIEEGEIQEGDCPSNNTYYTDNVECVSAERLSPVDINVDRTKKSRYYDRDFKPKRAEQTENEKRNDISRPMLVYDDEFYKEVDSWDIGETQNNMSNDNDKTNDQRGSHWDKDNQMKNHQENNHHEKSDHKKKQSGQIKDHRESNTKETKNKKNDSCSKNGLDEDVDELEECVVDIKISSDERNQRNIQLHNRNSIPHGRHGASSRKNMRTSRATEQIKIGNGISLMKPGQKRPHRSHSRDSERNRQKIRKIENQHVSKASNSKYKESSHNKKSICGKNQYRKGSQRSHDHSFKRKSSSPILLENGQRVDIDNGDLNKIDLQSGDRYGSPVSDRSMSPYERLSTDKHTGHDKPVDFIVCTPYTTEEQKKSIAAEIYKKMIWYLSGQPLKFMYLFDIKQMLSNDQSFRYKFQSDNVLSELLNQYVCFFASEIEGSGQCFWPKTDIKICHIFTANPNNKHNCHDLHICKYHVLFKCDKPGCKFGHKLFDGHNRNVLREYFLDGFGEQQIKTLVRTKESRNVTTLPLVCKFYNNEGGCTRPNCMHLHLCRYFLNGTCKFEHDCKRLHTIREGQPARILNYFYAINPYEDDGTIIELISKTMDDNKIKLKRDLIDPTYLPHVDNHPNKSTTVKDKAPTKQTDDNPNVTLASNTNFNYQNTKLPEYIPLDCGDESNAMPMIKSEAIKDEKDSDIREKEATSSMLALNSDSSVGLVNQRVDHAKLNSSLSLGIVKQELGYAKTNSCQGNHLEMNDVQNDSMSPKDSRIVVIKEENTEKCDDISRKERTDYLNTCDDRADKETMQTNNLVNNYTDQSLSNAENSKTGEDLTSTLKTCTEGDLPTKMANLPSWKSLRFNLNSVSCIDNRDENIEAVCSLIPKVIYTDTKKEQDLKSDKTLPLKDQTNTTGPVLEEMDTSDADSGNKNALVADANDCVQTKSEQCKANRSSDNVDMCVTDSNDELKDEVYNIKPVESILSIPDNEGINCVSPPDNNCDKYKEKSSDSAIADFKNSTGNDCILDREIYSNSKEEMTRYTEVCDVEPHDNDSINQSGENGASPDKPVNMEQENAECEKGNIEVCEVTSNDVDSFKEPVENGASTTCCDTSFHMEQENGESGNDNTTDHVTSDDIEEENVELVIEYKDKNQSEKMEFRRRFRRYINGVWRMAKLSDEWNDLSPDDVQTVERFIDIMKRRNTK